MSDGLQRAFAAYRTSGYCVLPGLLPRAALTAVLEEMEELALLQLRAAGAGADEASGGRGLLPALERLLAADVQRYLAALRHAAKLLRLARLTTDPALLAAVNALGLRLVSEPTTPVLHVMGDSLRVPGGYHGLGAHQDWPSVQGGLDTVTAWIPFTDVSQDSYPVEVLPGSHLRGLCPRVREDSFEIDPQAFDAQAFVRVPAVRGDVVLFSAFTIHRTALAGCRGFRLAASTRYENGAEPSFVRRAYPCAYQRSVKRELFTEGFTTPAEVNRQLQEWRESAAL